MHQMPVVRFLVLLLCVAGFAASQSSSTHESSPADSGSVETSGSRSSSDSESESNSVSYLWSESLSSSSTSSSETFNTSGIYSANCTWALEGSACCDIGYYNKPTKWLGFDPCTDTCPCGLPGVTCNTNKRVTELDLGFSYLAGTIPSSIVHLSYLEVLDVGFNKLLGPVPQEFYQFPRLTRLSMAANYFVGGLNASIAKLKNLKTLYAPFNNFYGSLPPEIGNLTLLESINLAGCSLSGAFPTFFGKLSNLLELHVSNYSNFSHSFFRDLEGNRFSGQLPTQLFSATNLHILRLSGNKLYGTLPTEVGNLGSLKILDLRNCKLAGTIPSEITKLLSLEILNIASNRFHGGFPSSIGNLANLQTLQAYSIIVNGTRCFGGQLPDSIGDLHNLLHLELTDNDFSGTIPSTIGNLRILKTLRMAYNRLTGEIPSSIGLLTSLTDLDFSLNRLTGTIPTHIKFMTRLSIVDLGFNALSGTVPDNFYNANLTFISLAWNRFAGTMPPSLATKNLKNLNLAGNFFCEVPAYLFTSSWEADRCNLEYNCLSYLDSKCNCNMTRNLETECCCAPYCSQDVMKSEVGVLCDILTANKPISWLNASQPVWANGSWVSWTDPCTAEPNIVPCKQLQMPGVECNSTTNQILSINLTSSDLTGSLPTTLVSLSALKNLFLDSNHLCDSLPSPVSDFWSNLNSCALGGNCLDCDSSDPCSCGVTSNVLNCSHCLPLGNTASDLALLCEIKKQNNPLLWRQPYSVDPCSLSGSTVKLCIDIQLYGVQCDTVANRIISIDLHNQELTGTIPPIIATANYLEFLDLSDNYIFGSAQYPSSILMAILEKDNNCQLGRTCLDSGSPCNATNRTDIVCKSLAQCEGCYIIKRDYCANQGSSDPESICQICNKTNNPLDWETSPDGTACDDNIWCTETSQCYQGECIGSADNCADESGYTCADPRVFFSTAVSTEGTQPTTIFGINFGNVSSLSISIGGSACSGVSVISEGTQLSCTPTPGVGARLPISLTVGNSTFVFDNMFSFAVPVLSFTTVVNTDGKEKTTVSGYNFGPPNSTVSVFISGKECTNAVVIDHRHITCYPPPGVGKFLNLTVIVPNSTHSQSTTTPIFSFQPPTVISATSTSTQTLGVRTFITGTNFGPANNTAVTVLIHGLSCDNVVVHNHTTLSCQPPAGNGKDRLVVVTVAGQSGSAQVFSYFGPTILSTSPTGTAGGWISITGTDFGNSASMRVTIDGKECLGVGILSLHYQISCQAPPGAGVNLTVKMEVPYNPSDMKNLQLASANIFSYLAPSIINATPASTSGGNPTIIDGSHFGPLGTKVSVSIGNQPCGNAKVVVAHKQITCYPPVGFGSAHNVTLKVPSSGGHEVTVPKLFSYSAPTIDFIEPTNTTGSAPIVIHGSSFGAADVSVSVEVSQPYAGVVLPCNVTAAGKTHSTISCFPPPGIDTKTILTVWVPSKGTQGGLVSNVSGVSLYLKPVILRTTPANTDGESRTLIEGYNFGPANYSTGEIEVTISSKHCTDPIVVKDHTQISCFPPEGVGDNNAVVLYVGDLETTGLFNYSGPNITTVEPCSTTGGMTTLLGNNFGPGGSAYGLTSTYDNVETAATWVSHRQLKIFIAEGVGCQHSVLVTVIDNKSPLAQFCYSLPNVKSATAVDTRGDSSIIINGLNFGNETVTVKIAGEYCENARISIPHVQISCIAPPGTGANNTIKIWVPAEGDSRSQSATSAFKYSYKPPHIYNVSSPPTEGGDVIIQGSSFGSDVNKILAFFGNISCEVVLQVPQQILRTTIPSGSGVNHSLLIMVDGLSGSTIVSFEKPQVSSVSAEIPTGGGMAQINGYNFGTAPQKVVVRIGDKSDLDTSGAPCTGITISTPHRTMSCTAPPGQYAMMPLTVCVDSQCARQENQISYDDVTAPSCTLTSTGDETLVGVGESLNILCECDDYVRWFSSADISLTGGCTLAPFNYSEIVPFADRTGSFLLNVSRGNTASCELKILSDAICDYADNCNTDEVSFQLSFEQVSSTSSDNFWDTMTIALIAAAGGALCLALAGLFVAGCIVAKKRKKAVKAEQKAIAMTEFWKVEDDDSDSPAEKFDPNAFTLVEFDDFLLKVSTSELSFGLGGHQAVVDKKLREKVVFTNIGRGTVSFKIFSPHSYKYKIMASPENGKIGAGEELTIDFAAKVLATTVFETKIPIVACFGTEFDPRKALYIYLKWPCESKLSTKLDLAEIVLHLPAIGEGSFGSVYRGEWRGQSVAVKVLKDQGASHQDDMYDEFLREVKIMEELKCPQIVNFVGAVYNKKKPSIITEFVQYGSLSGVMKEPLSDRYKCKILLDTARGMDFLHQSGIIHRDLKLDNVLVCSLDPSDVVCGKISDFGTTRDIQNVQSAMQMTTAIGTPSYMSPEILRNDPYGAPTDVYSFGVLAYALWQQTEPYSSGEFNSSWKVVDFVVSGQRLPFPNTVPEFMSSLITRCWAQDPAARPEFSEVARLLEEAMQKLQ
ncbi:protein brassinosteroid insensitive 1 [Pelomyxa schiedti]|nr:protein brassinosteroid insensitive 1 [Pelomyxa schiedti]